MHTTSTPMVVGANLPWIAYGQDFGGSAWRPRGGIGQSDMRERARSALARLADSGAGLVRWWVLADGRSGLHTLSDGSLALDDRTLDDLDVAIEVLRETGLRAVFVLMDFLWFAPPRHVNGVQLGGRTAGVRESGRREVFIDRVVAPIARRYGGERAVAAWDLMNEPEWAVLGLGTLDPRRGISRAAMRRLLRGMATAFQGAGATQPRTVGLARLASLPFVEDLGLDLYQAHWYESHDSLQALAESVSRRALDRPLLLGELPTRGASVPVERLLRLADAAGYWGALPWSLLADDHASDAAACHRALSRWRSTLPATGAPRSSHD